MAGITPVTARRSTEHGSGLGVHRWIIEQSIALPHGFRGLRIRWEIHDDIHEAFLSLSPAPSSAGADSPARNFVRSSICRSAHKYTDAQRPLFDMSEHPGSDCAAVARGNGLSFRPDQPACPGRPGHRRRHGPAGSWVCARGAAGPVAALTRSPGRARPGRPVPGGQDASRWLLPGGQPGLPAAVIAWSRCHLVCHWIPHAVRRAFLRSTTCWASRTPR